jgi:hypothetical protein
MTQKSIKLNFSDFWPNFDKRENYFYNLLNTKFTIEISEKPDFLIYSCFGTDYLKYSCIRIQFITENLRPDFTSCDFAFSFDYSKNIRNYRLPLYALYGDINALNKNINLDEAKEILKKKECFCNIVVSNENAKKRIDFFKKLSQYKKVDSGGRFLNNIGGPITNKIEFLQRYKFTLSFENSSYPGYTTEKIFEPMLANSIPVYWGNPIVHNDFNTKSFINYHDYKNDAKVIEKIIKIDQNDNLFLEMLMQPRLNNNQINTFTDPQNVLARFESIISQKDNIVPVAKTYKKHLHFIKRKSNIALFELNKIIPLKINFR